MELIITTFPLWVNLALFIPFHGQTPTNGYFQFHFTAELLKKRYVRVIGEEKRFIEEVYLEERDQMEDGRLVEVWVIGQDGR